LILSDNVKAWQMNADGIYSLIDNDSPKVNSQALLLARSALKTNSCP